MMMKEKFLIVQIVRIFTVRNYRVSDEVWAITYYQDDELKARIEY